MAGFFITEAAFGLVASAADVLPRITMLRAGKDPSGLGARALPSTGGQTEYEVSLLNEWQISQFVLNAPPGTEFSIQVEGERDAFLLVSDASAIC